MSNVESILEKGNFWGDDLRISYLGDIVNSAGENWKLPEYATHKRHCVQEIVLFLQGVQVGRSLVHEATYRRISPSDLTSVASYLNLFAMLRSQEGLSDETIIETVEGAIRAFSALLGNYDYDRTDMQPIDRDDAIFLAKAISRAQQIADTMPY